MMRKDYQSPVTAIINVHIPSALLQASIRINSQAEEVDADQAASRSDGYDSWDDEE